MPKRKRKLTSPSKSSLLREIDGLSKEIGDLESKCEQQELKLAQELSFQSLDKVVEKLSDFKKHSSAKGEDENADKIKEEIETLLARKEKLEALTGFVFEEDRVVLITSSDNNNNSVQQWRRVLKGQCLDISFEIDFVTNQKEQLSKQGEEEKEKSKSYAEVTKLDVQINNPIVQNELEIFLTKVKQENSLGNFLQVLPQYARCYNYRKKSFMHFEATYPELVYLIPAGTEHSTYMVICNRQKSGIQFTVCWDILVENSGHIVPQLDAFAFCLGDVGEEDDNIVKSTPEMFRKILSQYGIEKAVELLISIVNE